MITLGSLFSGIGGLELGLENALRDGGFDVSTIWQCESNPWCRSVLARHWPDAVRFDDVRVVTGDAPAVDILCGGFPCQDVSFAGEGAGLAGERSGLWFEFARIARELRPRIVVVENVAALASRGLDAVLGTLSEAGYDAVWFDLRASDVGAPHRRERIFIVAWRRDVGDSTELRRKRLHAKRRGARKGEGQGRMLEPLGAGSPVADSNRGRCEGERSCGVLDGERSSLGHDADGRDGARAGVGQADPDGDGLESASTDGVVGWQRSPEPRFADGDERGESCGAQPRVGRDADGLPCGVDITAHRWPVGPGETQPEEEPPRVTKDRTQRRQRLKALGNAVVPQVAYVVGCVVADLLRRGVA